MMVLDSVLTALRAAVAAEPTSIAAFNMKTTSCKPMAKNPSEDRLRNDPFLRSVKIAHGDQELLPHILTSTTLTALSISVHHQDHLSQNIFVELSRA